MTSSGQSSTDSGRERSDTLSDRNLVFALGHELGNLIGAVRLHAHLLDHDMTPASLAQASVDLDDLSARSAALLGLIRPLLTPEARSPETLPVSVLMGNLKRPLTALGGRGTRLRFELDPELVAVRIDVGVIQRLIESFFFLAIDATAGRGEIVIRAESQGGRIALCVEDDGPGGEDPAGFRDQAMRGRPLLCAVADTILLRQGGDFEVARIDDRTRIVLILPAIPLPAR
ncbi:MAG: hypothetical protein OSB70_07955 [Myxococcota bacterium]|nr:hypothetical protein [Myxococcota bacterium]